MITLSAHLSIVITSILICGLFIVHYKTRFQAVLEYLEVSQQDNRKLMEENLTLQRKIMLIESGQKIERTKDHATLSSSS